MPHNKVIGIIGGVGPVATADLFTKLIGKVRATCDQEYPRVVVDSDPSVPDRTRALVGGGENPVPALVSMGQRLIHNGAQVLGIPCNTAHAFFEEIRSGVSVPIINMINEVVAHVHISYPHARRVGVLATTGTHQSRVYEIALAKAGLELVKVSECVQETCVMEAIYGVGGLKSGGTARPRELLERALADMEGRVDAIVLACTELPLVLSGEYDGVPFIDSTSVLADALLRESAVPDAPVPSLISPRMEAA